MDYDKYFKEGIRYNVMGSDEDSTIDIIAGFIAWGVKNNKKCYYYVDNNCFEELEFFLGEHKLDLVELIGTGKLTISSARKFYTEKKADVRCLNLMELVKMASEDGYNGLAMVADRNCFLESGFTEEVLYEYEKLLAKLLNESPIAAISCYNIDKFGIDAFFALNHLNPNFIYRLQSEIFVHDGREMGSSEKESLEIVYNFLKARETIKRENRLYQFISKLSGELSYKEEENDIMETALSSICKTSYASFGSAVVDKQGSLDLQNIISYNVPAEMLGLFKVNMASSEGKLQEIFSKRNCRIFHFQDFSSEEKKLFKKYNIYSSIIIPVKFDGRIYGYIYLCAQNKYISFEDNSQFLCKVCENVAKMIIEYRKYKKTQEGLIQARKMKALGELTGGIAHEFNNILTPVLGYTQILKSKVKDVELLKYINMIENSAMDGASIVKRIQEFSRPGQKEMTIINIDDSIRQCVDITAPKWSFESQVKRKFIKVNLDLKSNAVIKGEATEVREIFINLMTNAVDAMPDGGNIYISSYNHNKEVVIKVRDTGTGMTKEVMENIFDPFFTTKKDRGNGLGLSLVYNMIRTMKGSIDLESELGSGTEFILRFPINYESEGVFKVESSNTSTISKKVLVIDDQLAVAETVCEMLMSIGHRAEFATNDREALSKLVDNNYDCVLSDLALGSASGIQLSKEIKGINGDTRFVLMTGWPGKLKKEDLEFIDFILQKPFSIDQLNKAVCGEFQEEIRKEA